MSPRCYIPYTEYYISIVGGMAILFSANPSESKGIDASEYQNVFLYGQQAWSLTATIQPGYTTVDFQPGEQK